MGSYFEDKLIREANQGPSATFERNNRLRTAILIKNHIQMHDFATLLSWCR